MDPVEIGRGELIMGLDRSPMRRGLGELELRLGPAFIIFPLFLRHLTQADQTLTGLD